jgi:dephospho-CoA kinase
MLRLRKVAVTGGLSCGKSSVCRYFKELGAYVVSADEIVHQLLSPNTSIGQQVISLLGSDVIVDKKIDRHAIARKVFNNPKLLHSLEQLIHPSVEQEIEKQYQQVKKQGAIPLFIAEIPLLFEVANEHNFDAIITVWANEEQCKQRFKNATRYADEEFYTRMTFQVSPEEKIKRADYVIDNSGSIEQMHKNVLALFLKLRG